MGPTTYCCVVQCYCLSVAVVVGELRVFFLSGDDDVVVPRLNCRPHRSRVSNEMHFFFGVEINTFYRHDPLLPRRTMPEWSGSLGRLFEAYCVKSPHVGWVECKKKTHRDGSERWNRTLPECNELIRSLWSVKCQGGLVAGRLTRWLTKSTSNNRWTRWLTRDRLAW